MDSVAGWREGVVSNKKVKAASHSLGLGGSAWVEFQITSSGETGNPGERGARWDAGGWDRTDVKT